jgi:hypothetical protein
MMRASLPPACLGREQKADDLKDNGQGCKNCGVAVQSALGSHLLHQAIEHMDYVAAGCLQLCLYVIGRCPYA